MKDKVWILGPCSMESEDNFLEVFNKNTKARKLNKTLNVCILT